MSKEQKKCPVCNGSGTIAKDGRFPGDEGGTCDNCNGTGKVDKGSINMWW